MNDLTLVKGVGPKSSVYLSKLNIHSIDDLINHFPFRYEVLSRSDIFSLKQDDKIIIDGFIESMPNIFRFRGNKNKMSFRLKTNTAVVSVIIFNRGFLKPNLTLNKEVTVIGRWDLIKNTIIASDIIFEGLSDKPKIIPIYHTTSGLSRKKLKRCIEEALKLKCEMIDYIPSPIMLQYKFIDKVKAVNIIHQPNDINELKRSMLRLKYEELFMFMVKINILKQRQQKLNKGYAKNIYRSKVNSFIGSLPFNLTPDQMTAIDDILNDISSNQAMNRLLQGDVGSGKTVVAVIAIYVMYLNRYQSAMMVPTEILAKQHYDNVKTLFNDININIELLLGSTSKREKEQIYQRLEKGTTNLVIGTHAVMQEIVSYHNLGLVITDEQHRFGVRQRSNLKNKGIQSDVLYMSATPIPRTYALTIYGDMDISNIKTMPSNRKPVITYLKHPKEIKDILVMIHNELLLNHQIYVVAPLIEESDNIDLENINKLKQQFELAFGKNHKIGMLHGKMTSNEKETIMSDFADNKINILISTTVIEVGIDVKNATMMIIFDAKRFGLSTLHQLRGRVGRSDLQSYCILISDKEKERLKIMTETNDGFKISEEDFKLRGQGDLFGVRQSGDMNFKIADFKKDFKILMQAKRDAEMFVNNDSIDEYPHIKVVINNSVNLD